MLECLSVPHLSFTSEQESLKLRGERGFSPLIDFLGTEHFLEHHKHSLSNCWNKSFRELTLKANKRAHPSEAAHWEPMDWIWPTYVFHLACAVQKTTETAFENMEISQDSRFAALLVSSPASSSGWTPPNLHSLHGTHERPGAGLLSHVQDLSQVLKVCDSWLLY